jgi:virginiamycin B lyase
MKRALGAALLAGAFVACGGGGGGAGTSLAPGAPTSAGATTNATFVLTLQTGATSSAARRAQFLDSATQSVQIVLTQVNGSPPSTPVQTVANVGPSAPGCSATASGVTCSIGVGAVVGNDTYTITAYAQPNAGGAALSTGSTTFPVVVGGSNAAAIALSGVVASLGVALANPYLPTGVTGTTAVTVTAKDAAGNTIVGPYSNAVALTASDPSVSISPASTTSSATALLLTFSGTLRSAVTVSAALGPTTATTSLVPATNIVDYHKTSALGNAFQIVQGPDGALYFAELGPFTLVNQQTNFIGAAGPGAIGRLDPATGTVTDVPLGSTQYEPIGMLFTPDGALWTAAAESGDLVRISPFGAAGVAAISLALATPSPLPTPPATAPLPRSLAYLGGNVYVTLTAGNAIGVVSATSPFTAGTPIPLPTATNVFGGRGPARPEGITVGSDGNLWVAATFHNRIYRVNPSIGTVTGFSTGLTLTEPRFVASGSDGNLYMTGLGIGNLQSLSGFLVRFTTAGAATPIALPTPGQPDTIVPGPAGTLYFADLMQGAIGSVTTSGAVQVWPVATAPTAADDGPQGLVYASDGTIYFTTTSTGSVDINGPFGFPKNEIRRLILAQGWTLYPPAPIAVNGIGTVNAQLLGIAESGDSSPFTATSSNPAIASVSAIAGFPHNFVVAGVAPGTATIAITDRNGRSVTATVNVTQTTGSIQSRVRSGSFAR